MAPRIKERRIEIRGRRQTDGTTLFCACGCGKPLSVKVHYVPGHDSRHVSKTAHEIAQTGDRSRLAEFPSEALREKVLRQVASITSRQVQVSIPPPRPITQVPARKQSGSSK